VIRILIADDHPILRRGLRDILSLEFENLTCGEAGNAHQVVAAVQSQSWDLLILDVTMPGRSGLDVLRDVRKLQPKLPVLVLSVHSVDQFGARSLRGGASGYMNKDSAPEELIGAVRKVLTGSVYVSPTLALRLALDVRENSERLPHESLSAREFEILRMLGTGKTVTEIAEELNLSAPTVSTHRAHILTKMNMTTTAALIAYAVRNNMVD
jgi:two-component system invasion response regulator UvrY